jgi:uncharacterized protein YoxC
MTNEERNKLIAIVVYLVTQLKSNAAMIAELNGEIAALKMAVKGLDPTFQEVLEHKRSELEPQLEPLNQTILAQYDEMIQQVQDGKLL